MLYESSGLTARADSLRALLGPLHVTRRLQRGPIITFDMRFSFQRQLHCGVWRSCFWSVAARTREIFLAARWLIGRQGQLLFSTENIRPCGERTYSIPIIRRMQMLPSMSAMPAWSVAAT